MDLTKQHKAKCAQYKRANYFYSKGERYAKQPWRNDADCTPRTGVQRYYKKRYGGSNWIQVKCALRWLDYDGISVKLAKGQQQRCRIQLSDGFYVEDKDYLGALVKVFNLRSKVL